MGSARNGLDKQLWTRKCVKMDLKWTHICALLAAALLIYLPEVHTKTESTCYGTDPTCHYYSLICNSSEIIRLGDLKVGNKSEMECPQFECANDTKACCSHDNSDPNDVLEPFNLQHTFDTYTNCSGEQSCDNIHTPWQQMSHTKASSYAVLEFECVPVSPSNLLNICGKNKTTLSSTMGQDVELMFDRTTVTSGTPPSNNSCECRVTNTASQQGTSAQVTIDIVDARLQLYEREKNASKVVDCSSASLKISSDELRCSRTSGDPKNKNFTYNYSRVVSLGSGASFELALENLLKTGPYDYPEMVWVRIRGTADLNITCGQSLPPLPPVLTSTTPVITAATTSASDVISTASSASSLSASSTTASTASSTASQTPATSASKGDGLSDEELLMAILIPLFGVLILALIIACCCWARQRRKRPAKFNFMKGKPETYENFRNSKILDNYISKLTVDDNPAGLRTTLPPTDLRKSVPVSQTLGSSVQADRQTNTNKFPNGRASINVDNSTPITGPIKLRNSLAFSNKPGNTQVNGSVQPAVVYDTSPNSPTVLTSTMQTEAPSKATQRQSVYRVRLQNEDEPSSAAPRTIQAPKRSSVTVVRVGNLSSDGTVQPTETSINNMPDNKQPTHVRIQRLEATQENPVAETEAAVISTDTIEGKRNSSSAYLMPGTGQENVRILFVK